MKPLLFLFVSMILSHDALCGEYDVDHVPLVGVYFGGEYTRSLVIGYGATFKRQDSKTYGPSHNGLYADVEISSSGRALSLGYLRTSDVGVARIGITSLVTDTEDIQGQQYIGVTLTMSVFGLSFRLGSYQEVAVDASSRRSFSSAAIGIGF